MQNRLLGAFAVLVAAGAVVVTASGTAPPVGPLPKGPVQTVARPAGATFRVTLSKPTVAGGAWRVARAYDAHVVREVDEGTTLRGAVWVSFRAVAPGTTRVVYAVTRGERAHAYAARTFRVVVSAAQATSCPDDLLPLTRNSIGPAVVAALAREAAKNRPQVTAAAIAVDDAGRGAQAKSECGARVQARTVVVYITDRAFLPSQSASQHVLFVGRTTEGYRVWRRVH
jgi:hypothetical protein